MVMAGTIGIKCLMFQYTSILLVYGVTGDLVSTEIPIALQSILDEYFSLNNILLEIMHIYKIQNKT